MRVGILGGTFDPVHIGHLLAAERVWEEAELDEIWFMPSHIPPHKTSLPSATTEERWMMLLKATAPHPHFRPIDIELKRGGTSYTYDTMLLLKKLYPKHDFSFIVGGDMVASLPHWYKIDALSALVRFIGLERPGTRIDWAKIDPELRKKIRMLPMPAVDISSTEIRRRRREGKSVRFMVDEAVRKYMEEQRLYES